MKLQSVSMARSIWLFSTSDLNPRGKALVPVLSPLVQRYKFINFPKTAEQLTGNEFKFESGQFTGQAGDKLAVDLTVYKDGLVADTRSSTKDSDLFLHDIMTWLHQEHGLLKYDTVVRKKLYVSELYVTCEQLLDNLNAGLMDFREVMSRHDSGYGKFPVEITGISFGFDPENTMSKSVNFNFERAVSVPFAQDRYYSWAPFPTDTHLALLKTLEIILTGSK